MTLTALVNNHSQIFPGLANQSLHISQESQITMLLKRIVCVHVRVWLFVYMHVCVREKEIYMFV